MLNDDLNAIYQRLLLEKEILLNQINSLNDSLDAQLPASPAHPSACPATDVERIRSKRRESLLKIETTLAKVKQLALSNRSSL